MDAFEHIQLRRDGLLQRAKQLINKYKATSVSCTRSIYDTGEEVEHYPLYSVDCRDLFVQVKQRTTVLINVLLKGIANSR